MWVKMRARAQLGEESHVFRKVCRGPGRTHSVRARAGPSNARLALPRLALPRLGPAAPVGPDPFVPWDPPHHGMPLSLLPSFLSLSLSLSGFSLVSPRWRGGAASFNISRRSPPWEFGLSSSSNPSSDPLRSSSLLVPTPLKRPEHSLDSILMECLRGRYLPHCRVCSLVLSHSSRAPLLCWLALRWPPRWL